MEDSTSVSFREEISFVSYLEERKKGREDEDWVFPDCSTPSFCSCSQEAESSWPTVEKGLLIRVSHGSSGAVGRGGCPQGLRRWPLHALHGPRWDWLLTQLGNKRSRFPSLRSFVSQDLSSFLWEVLGEDIWEPLLLPGGLCLTPSENRPEVWLGLFSWYLALSPGDRLACDQL
ncbi:Hypothetical predicted protein [Marmota monax]|uniref:Uncharacterized protein n=1 Tax=Marmota monax TaxID=9995 RepID=A0A5E4A9W5_MARMO|nr:hypothetical protein GHT09_009145 [Marmota monax]VTJ53835.1 Hypothetical predicted protein [Marmota monax]